MITDVLICQMICECLPYNFFFLVRQDILILLCRSYNVGSIAIGHDSGGAVTICETFRYGTLLEQLYMLCFSDLRSDEKCTKKLKDFKGSDSSSGSLFAGNNIGGAIGSIKCHDVPT